MDDADTEDERPTPELLFGLNDTRNVFVGLSHKESQNPRTERLCYIL